MAASTELRLPTARDWKAQIIEDIELQAIDAGQPVPPTARGSHFDLESTALGNALAVLTANQVQRDADSDPTRATGAALEEQRVAIGLPEVLATPASGKVIVATTSVTGLTLPDGMGLLFPGAMTAQVSGTHVGVLDGDEVNFGMVKAGVGGNLDAGTIGRFTAPISGLAQDCAIVENIRNGADVETDARKRRRILNRRQNPPACGNWSHLRELALNVTNAVDDAFVYPALGGPASCRVALVSPWFKGAAGQSRVASAATIALVEGTYTAYIDTDDNEIVVSACADEPTDVRFLLDVAAGPASWTDATPWPQAGAIVGAVTSNYDFHIVLASVAAAPVVGQSIAIWSVAELAFRTATIEAATAVSALEYSIEVGMWQGGAITVTAGQYVSPAAGNLTAWGEAVLDFFGSQTPGEACLVSQEPRSLRKPSASADAPMGVGTRELAQLTTDFTEIVNAEIDGVVSITPTRVIPSVLPNVLVLRKLAFGVL